MIKKLLIQPMFLLSLVLVTLSSNKVAAQSPVLVQNASGPNICDGYAYLIDSTAIVSTISWQGNGAVVSGTMSVNNLCPGTYLCYYAYQSPTGLDSNFVSFVIGTGTTNPCAGFQVASTVTNTTTALLCNGSIAVSVTGGSGPYAYYWTNNLSGSNPTNLCAGSYGVMVMDANGCADSLTSVVSVASTPTVSDSLIIYNPNPYPNTPVLGTLTSTLEDCLLNFNAVDSVAMTGISPFTVNPGASLDSVLVTWTVWDTTGTVIATYPIVYFMSNTTLGVYNFMFVVYCSQKSTDVKTIIVNQFMNLNSLSLESNEETMFTIVNPIANELVVDLQQAQSGTIVVTDASGKVVAQKEFLSDATLSFDAASWNKGMYFVTLSTGNKFTTRKVIK